MNNFNARLDKIKQAIQKTNQCSTEQHRMSISDIPSEVVMQAVEEAIRLGIDVSLIGEREDQIHREKTKGN